VSRELDEAIYQLASLFGQPVVEYTDPDEPADGAITYTWTARSFTPPDRVDPAIILRERVIAALKAGGAREAT
jgi:hypothetical protein